jgi:hypothetical protein
MRTFLLTSTRKFYLFTDWKKIIYVTNDFSSYVFTDKNLKHATLISKTISSFAQTVTEIFDCFSSALFLSQPVYGQYTIFSSFWIFFSTICCSSDTLIPVWLKTNLYKSNIIFIEWEIKSSTTYYRIVLKNIL